MDKEIINHIDINDYSTDHSYFDSDEHYSIGEISKICAISAKMLRYYDKIGLLKPSYIDDETNYRFYSKNEIILLTLIKELKALGLEINQINTIFQNKNIKTIANYYDNINTFIDEEIEKLNHIKSRINQQKGKINLMLNSSDKKQKYDFSIKKLNEMYVLYMNLEIRLTDENIQLLINEAQKGANILKVKIMDPYFIIIPDDNVNKASQGELTQIEACVNTKDVYDPSLPYIKHISENIYASVLYSGPFNTTEFMNINENINKWIISNGYKAIGNRMILFLNYVEYALFKKEIKLELLIPVKKT